MDAKKPIIALDFQELDQLEHFLDQFSEALNVKIGMELYYTTGLTMIEKLQERGHDIFLDLKLHDIPNTVKWAMKTLAKQGVAMVNVHALGGKAMMEAAHKGLGKGTPAGKKRPVLLAVTQLTSTSADQLANEQQVSVSMEESVRHLAELTQAAGLDGVVCSPLEAKAIKEQLGQDFLTVTPGIRLEKGADDDQQRVATPYEAALNGCDYIVVGRPITQADDPVAAYRKICQSWQEGLKEKGRLHE
ncbi:orotidine-5'-phosphate decarboxylase [Ignavigranum ruoffiae]|uniref:Orotidine 5'-phosphate decarboxylase n=1 Tax=Ignavigranum ruoffiae TaxID=89093 RepID=A0A1H9D3D1_9LACT|nr:orotidine-5'-phosphate decarboxylase [Ignavigranum ruoffiae]SEQ07982.1 orotidine-5'-phosphate decarboxylase [Ignavigranum ruoffiae]